LWKRMMTIFRAMFLESASDGGDRAGPQVPWLGSKSTAISPTR
jgi:hypothetical protein